MPAEGIVMSAEPGARIDTDGVTFTVWAPRHRSVVLRLDEQDIAMQPERDGYFSTTVADARAGQRYWFMVEGRLLPDPASRFQPDGVSGPSAIVDPRSFPWTDAEWTGAPPAHRNVVYEMHLGTFTSAGTWGAARTQLQRLADLGVTTLEILPVAEFSGRFGWGYDGVFLFAPYHEYGTPDDARVFINDAHRLGLSVILDVVYNHLGPVGNVLPQFSDWYFAEHDTDWGRGFNVDGPQSAPVRQFMRANVRHWIREYHFDGLRFDAIHSIHDRSSEHIVRELTRHARAVAAPRRLYVVAENESQNVAFLEAGGDNGSGALDGLWNEDWHHSAFVALTGQNEAYCTDYDGSANEFASMARWNLLYQGQWYSWQKQLRGTDARGFAGAAFVCFLENHDQVANTGRGVRLHQLTNPARWRAMVSLLLLGPSVPMLFQGQECATTSPFTYFADHEGELAEAVRTGRLDFLSQFPTLADPETRAHAAEPGRRDRLSPLQDQLVWSSGVGGGKASAHGSPGLRRSDWFCRRWAHRPHRWRRLLRRRAVVLLRYSAGDEERLILVNLGRRTTLRMNDPLLAPPSRQRWVMIVVQRARGLWRCRRGADVDVAASWTLQGELRVAVPR